MDFGASPTNLFAFTLDGELKWEQISDESNVPLAITTNSSGKQIAILSTGDAYDTALTAYEVETGAILWTNTFA